MRIRPALMRGASSEAHIGQCRYSPGQKSGGEAVVVLTGRVCQSVTSRSSGRLPPAVILRPAFCTTRSGGRDFTTAMKRAVAASAVLLSATLVWGGLLVSGRGPWATDSAAVMVAGLVVLAAIAIVGMLVGASRWGRVLALVVAAAGPVMAVLIPVDAVWITGLALSVVAIYGLVGNATLGVIRTLPAASGPTPRVVAFALTLAAMPTLVAAVAPGGLEVGEWIVIVSGAVTAGLYAKAAPGALWAVRLLFPFATVGAAVATGMPRGLMWLAIGAGIGAFGWTKEARVAVRPLVEQGRAVPMLPEMVPPDILDAAGVDQRGRPRD
jgi:hypothetical protein